jgi:hypothetical protein
LAIKNSLLPIIELQRCHADLNSLLFNQNNNSKQYDMRHEHSRKTSRTQSRGEYGRSALKDGRRREHSSGFGDENEDWDYGEDNYRSEHGGYDREVESEKDRPYRRNRRTSAPGRKNPGSSRRTGVLERSRRKYRSTSRTGRASQLTARSSRKTSSRSVKGRRTRTAPRGFAAMPKSEVRRIAAMGGRASHGGGRPPGSKTRRKSAKRY